MTFFLIRVIPYGPANYELEVEVELQTVEVELQTVD